MPFWPKAQAGDVGAAVDAGDARDACGVGDADAGEEVLVGELRVVTEGPGLEAGGGNALVPAVRASP